MSKSRKVSKSTLAILALSLILAVSLVFGATFAWFKGSDETAQNSITMGTFKFALTGDKVTEQKVILFDDVTAAVPGQKITLNAVKADFTGSNVRAVLRVKVTIEGADAGSPFVDAVSLTDLESSSNWAKDGEYYYYLGIIDNTENAVTDLSILTNSSTITLSKALEAVEGVMGEALSIKLTAEAAQADYTNGSALTSAASAAEVKAVFDAVNAAA